MTELLRSELVGTAGLSVAAIVAVLLTVLRRPVAALPRRRQTTLAMAVVLVLQIVHAAEEFLTRFYQEFPSMLRLVEWPASFFLIVNMVCLALWTISLFLIGAGVRLAYAPAWFLAIAAMINGVTHPLIAMRAGGYFPGLYTAPLLGAAGIVMWRSLNAITEPDPQSRIRDLLLFLETIVFTVLVPGTVTIWLPRSALGIWGDTSPVPWTLRHTIALVPLTVGLVVYARCVWEFATRGHGIPAPIDHPKQLVVTGLYRYVRNPMYVGVLLVLLGEALFFGSLSFLEYTFIWFAFVHLAVLIYEEPNLRRKFGDSSRATVRQCSGGLRVGRIGVDGEMIRTEWP